MIKTGTNFGYEGARFLDNRQGQALTLDDLKNWNTVIPPGFETCVDGTWYIYCPNSDWSTSTGYFRKRIDVELSGSSGYDGVQGQLDELMNEVFPLTITTQGGGTYEMGRIVTPNISWTISRKGQSVNPTEAFVNGSTDGVAANLLSYTGSPINTTTNYAVKVKYDRMEANQTVSYAFRLKKYYGTSTKTSLTSAEILNLGGSTWATSWTMNATTFDCTGGKYPYYVIPSSLYNPSTFKVWVGGLRNTDIVATTQEITNAQNFVESYAVIRLGTKQTGVLSIRFGD